MSVADRIRKLQAERRRREQEAEQRAREEEAALQHQREEERLAREREREKEAVAEAKRIERRRQVVAASRVLEHLEVVHRETLSHLRKGRARLLIDDDYRRICLAWGSVVVRQSGGSWTFLVGSECSCIEVLVGENVLTINGTRVVQSEWEHDAERIEASIADAYMKPIVVVEPRYEVVHYTDSPQPECCHS